MPYPLTDRQRRVLTTLHQYARIHGRMPSRRELAHSMGYRSANSIQRYFKALEDKGYLRVEGYKWRGARLVEDSQELVQVPLVGNVACGTPIWSEENVEGFIPVERRFLSNSAESFFFLTARGDSMNDGGIAAGDLLLVERRLLADPDETVVALIGDEVTVKVYKPNAEYVALVPKSSNLEHRPIIVREGFTIQGVVRRVFKREHLSA